MKKIIILLCSVTIICSCSSSKNTSTITKKNVPEVPEKPATPKRVNNYPVK